MQMQATICQRDTFDASLIRFMSFSHKHWETLEIKPSVTEDYSDSLSYSAGIHLQLYQTEFIDSEYIFLKAQFTETSKAQKIKQAHLFY